MTLKREFSSNSLKNAITLASSEFNVDEDKIKYEIITEKTKYFGHSQREIFIEAWAGDVAGDHDKLSDFVQKMLELMKLKLTYNITQGKGFLRVDFSGEDYKLMLYQNGNLLNSIQYLLNRLYSDMVGKKIYCECEKFRKNREYELTHLAHRYARDVKKSGRPFNLKELNPFERRIIHMTINRYSDLESKSKGDSFQKIITIKKK
jgi:predicted RNA-binding protein Jag